LYVEQRVEANKLDFAVGIFDWMPGIKRVPFFRFSLMLARQDDGRPILHNTSQWSALGGETLISPTFWLRFYRIRVDQMTYLRVGGDVAG
jgi:hypothetical protein